MFGRESKNSAALVTGGAGFIGGHLVERLLASNVERVAVVDTYFIGAEQNLRNASARYGDRLVIYREDAADPVAMASVLREIEPDVVFNLATKALKYSFFNPPGACRINLDIALNLCELLRSDAFGRLIHLSSSEVYGTAVQVPMDENHPLNAETTYAAGKAAADLAIAAYVRMFDLPIVTLRPFNNYGPRQNEGAFAAVIPLTVQRLLRGERPVIEGDGEQTRDFIFVLDTVGAIIRAASASTTNGTVLNVGSGRETSIRELVETLCHSFDYAGEIAFVPARTADVLRHCADVTAAEQLLGPLSVTTLGAGLAATVDWYRESFQR